MLLNIDILLITCEALNMSIIHDMISYNLNTYSRWPMITSFDIFNIRHINPWRFQYLQKRIINIKLIYLTIVLINVIKDNSVIQQINVILNNTKKNSGYSIKSSFQESQDNQFLRRFRFLFRKYLDEKSFGQTHYSSNALVNQIAITNIYLLYLVNQKNGYNFLWSYLINYDIFEILIK
uniref:hypothetical protein n=1 Tax=Rhodaphanes brevistipitata TaxID=446136 RepID=UPI001FCE12E1|nr:hypothetical protein MW432_pgp049 [Rhodaphanes brevistipitata]UNJ18532.1 hypothetical protein [Rhodaphanes brevistipitata]